MTSLDRPRVRVIGAPEATARVLRDACWHEVRAWEIRPTSVRLAAEVYRLVWGLLHQARQFVPDDENDTGIQAFLDELKDIAGDLVA